MAVMANLTPAELQKLVRSYGFVDGWLTRVVNQVNEQFPRGVDKASATTWLNNKYPNRARLKAL